MIIGLGTDYTDMRIVEAMRERYIAGLTVSELTFCNSKSSAIERLACYAKRHAAKEAVIKALGSNDAIGGITLREIEITNTKSGRPIATLRGGAICQLAAITPSGLIPHIWITITDHPPVAIAVCVIEAASA